MKSETKPVTKRRSREPLSTRWKRMTAEEKHRRIVDAVLMLVAKHGVQGTTTARIAAAVGVSEPTIYRTFKDRRAMLVAAADRVWQQRGDELGAFEASDAMDYLRKVSEYHTAGIQKTQVSHYLHELVVAPPTDGLRGHLRGHMLSEAHHLAEVLEEGKAQGCIRPDIDSDDYAWRIMSVYWLEAMARLYGLEDVLLTGFSTRLFDTILNSMAGPAPTDLGGDPEHAAARDN
jgi:AcrR family transcriptional regulator